MLSPLFWFLLTALVGVCHMDIYMHNMRGSNNRLNERTANRRNGNRVFDSQNNNRGGYNVGDAGENAAQNAAQQYQMKYYASGATSKTAANGEATSYLDFQWTAQHGCGGNETNDPHKLNCNMVLQFMCEDPTPIPNEAGQAAKKVMRDGTNTQTQNYQNGNDNENSNAYQNRKNANVDANKVYQEPHEWYDACKKRERNKGLFTADQKVKDNIGATGTRQNPNGQRRGYECPEERDYYPYWHPTPWKDIAVLTDDVDRCKFYQKESFNVKPKGVCLEKWATGATNQYRHFSQINNEAACTTTATRKWVELHNFLEVSQNNALNANEPACTAGSTANVRYIWGNILLNGQVVQRCMVALDAPDCIQADWSRVNHLGNGKEGEMNGYTWKLPYFVHGDTKKCVTRLRYNISTDDYNPWNTTAALNRKSNEEGGITNNPQVNIGASNVPLQLAINTAQYGRTFQDRSHVFHILRREAGTETKKIFNLNVRGKRGNIVQTYPAIEYDFVPTNLNMKSDSDLVHIQWTGSNTHNNQPPGGDGQTGDAGEGKGGSDRSNILQMETRNDNFPIVFEKSDFLENIKVEHCLVPNCYKTLPMTPVDAGVTLGSAGRTTCVESARCSAQKSVQGQQAIQNTLDNTPASFPGILASFKKKGTFNYMCSRNNNFSNRSQKGTIIVE